MADADVVKLKINDQVYTLDMSDLELGEVGEIEDLCQRVVGDIDFSSARGMQGLVWIVMHRKDPTFTVADAGRIKLTAIRDETPDPDSEPEERPTPASRPRGKSGGTS